MTAVKNAIQATVTKVELRSRPSRDSGWYGSEHNDITLMVAFQTADGDEGWFFTPAARQSISSGGPYVIATLEENSWVTKKDWRCEGALGAMGFGDTPVSRIKVGDQITFKGRVKRQTRFGQQYWYVKRLDYDHDTAETERRESLRKRLAAAQQSSGLTQLSFEFRTQSEVTEIVNRSNGWSPEYDPHTLPDIPGVKWQRFGWCGCIYRYEANIEVPTTFCEWAEAGGKVEIAISCIK